MSPQSTSSRDTSHSRVLALPPRRGFFGRLFLDHPVAKVLSLVLAILVIFTIERELDAVLFQGTILVSKGQRVREGAAESDALVIRHDARFQLDLISESVKVTVTGLGKFRATLPRPLRATAEIPEARLRGIPDDGSLTLALEPSDVTIIGLPGVKVRLETPVEFHVSRRVEVTKPLEGVVDVASLTTGYEVDGPVRFRPEASAKILGPAPVLAAMTRVRVSVAAVEGWQPATRLEDPRLSLAEGQRVEAQVVTKLAEKVIRLTGVPIQMLVEPESDYDVTIAESDPSRLSGLVVRLVGPQTLVDALEADPAALAELAKGTLAAVVATRAIERVAQPLAVAGQDVQGEVLIVQIPKSLSDQGFRALTDHQVVVSVRRRPKPTNG